MKQMCMQRVNRSATGWLGSAVLLVLLAGCGGQRTNDSFVPSDATAREALQAGLDAWKEGKPPGRVQAQSSTIQVVDSQWQSGDRLENYEVVDAVPGDGPRQFSVRLTMKGGAGPKEVRFVIVGKDPIWVFRDTDYAQASTMGN
ncbi:MAG: hypothetical protein HY000_34800 [Planctomycetes bacterium]|nr:hypothetical protein [Planctomycetota bacterium]